MTAIEISTHKWDWRVCEAPGVEPVFFVKDQATRNNLAQFSLAAFLAGVPSRGQEIDCSLQSNSR
jgi:hypothetical protein